MLLTKLKVMTTVALILALSIGGVVLSAGQPDPTQQKSVPQTRAKDVPAAKTQAGTADQAADQAVGKAKYAVADLVVPIMGLDNQENKTKEDGLIGKIVRSVAPKSWKAKGGTGTILFSPKDYSLVVSNSQSVHTQVKPSDCNAFSRLSR